jgi:hypothetical protein
MSVTFVLPLDQASPRKLALVSADVLRDALTAPLAFMAAIEEASLLWRIPGPRGNGRKRAARNRIRRHLGFGNCQNVPIRQVFSPALSTW